MTCTRHTVTPHPHPARRQVLSVALALGASAAVLWGGAPQAAHAADAWPTRPVRIVVGFPGGSSPDLTARTLADSLSAKLGQPVVVENKPGASGNIATDLVAKSTDGHTVGLVINGNLTTAKQLNPKLPYDPAKDLAPISLLTTAPLVLVAQNSLPTGAAFFDAAKAAGAKWNYGSVGKGSMAHLGMEWLQSLVPGMKAVHVPYASTPAIVTAMLAGDVQMGLIAPAVALPQARAGKVKTIGITSSGRSAVVPELAPLSDAGVKGLNLEVWNALVAPASMPAAHATKLQQAVQQVLREPEIRQRLYAQGWQVVGTSPDGLSQRVRQETALFTQIIQKQGLATD